MIDNGGGGKIQASEPLGEGVEVHGVIGNVDHDNVDGSGRQCVDFLLFC